MHTLTVLFPVLISKRKCLSFCPLSVVPGEQNFLSSFSLSSFIFLLHAYPFFPNIFPTNTCSSKHLLSTYYVPITVLGSKDSRICKTQSLSFEKPTSYIRERHVIKLLLKEDTYTLEVCPNYRDEEW